MTNVQLAAHQAGGGRKPLTGPVRLKVSAVWPWPKSWSARKRLTAGAHYKTSRPDADNIGKLIGDALNGVAWLDDAQVVEVSITKQYGLSGATYVSVEPLTDE